MQHAVLVGRAFERPAGGGAHGDDAAAARLGAVDDRGGLLRDADVFAVHFMRGQVVLLHGAEGPDADVQQHAGDVHAAILDAREQLVGEVQAGRRRGGAAGVFRIDGLVAVVVLEPLGDVRRQRHHPDLVELFHKIAFILEPNQPDAALQNAGHLSGHAARVGEDGAGAGLFAGTGQTLPKLALARGAAQQNRLHLARMPAACPENARGDDLGVVEHKAVARPQQAGDVAEEHMPDPTGRAVNRHQAAHIPPLGRRLRDEPLGQLVKIRGTPQQIDA